MDFNALSGSPLDGMPKFDLVGPTVDDDVRRLVARYGSEAVGEALKRQTKPKRGRRRIPDWRDLRPYIEDDARLWLDGGNPFKARTDYAIAKAFADANRGHDHASTMQRIERKLRSKKHGRQWFVLVAAMEMSRARYSFKRHLAAYEALAAHDPNESWNYLVESTKGKIADYERWHGPAPDDLTMEEIETGATPPNALLGLSQPKRRGLFGSAKAPEA